MYIIPISARKGGQLHRNYWSAWFGI